MCASGVIEGLIFNSHITDIIPRSVAKIRNPINSRIRNTFSRHDYFSYRLTF